VNVFKNDHLACKSLAPDDALDHALDGCNVRHALVPPLGTHLNDDDVIHADELLDTTHPVEHSVDVRGRPGVAPNIDRASLSHWIVRHKPRRFVELRKPRHPRQGLDDAPAKQNADRRGAEKPSACREKNASPEPLLLRQAGRQF
jgi:hypothetical protein